MHKDSWKQVNSPSSSSTLEMGDTYLIILGSMVWVVTLPFLIFPYLFLQTWKVLSRIWVRLTRKNPDSYKPLNLSDTLMVPCPWANMLSLVSHCDGYVDVEEVRKTFRQNLLDPTRKHAVLYKTIENVFGYAYQKPLEKPPDLTKHIREIQLNPGENMSEILGREHYNNVGCPDYHTPGWEIILVHEPNRERTAVMWKTDHGYMDGICFRYLRDTYCQVQPDYPKPKGALPLTKVQELKVFLKSSILAPRHLRDVDKFIVGTHPWFGTDIATTYGPEYVLNYAVRPIEFSKFKKAAKLFNCKIIGLYIALHILTMKRLLKETGKLKASETDYGGRTLPIMLPIPIPGHPIMEGKVEFTNHVGTGVMNVPLKDMDTQTLLQEVDKEFTRMETNDQALCAFNLLLSSYIFPSTLVGRKFLKKPLNYKFFTLFNPFALTSTQDLRFGGKKVYCNQYMGGCNWPVRARGIHITPVFNGLNVDLAIGGSPDLVADVAEAEMYLRIYEEELEVLMGHKQTQEEGVTGISMV